ERGLALALAGEGGETLAAQVGLELEQVRVEARTAEARKVLERENTELLAALARVRQPWGTPDDEHDYPLEEAALGEILWRFGVAPDTDDAETAAAKIRERGPEMAVELAAVFEEWARVRGAGNIEGAGALLRVADLVDPDPMRVALREAIRRRDLTAILEATDEGLAEFPTRTLALLGEALAGQRLALEKALEVYRTGLARHPESYALHMGMQRVLLMLNPPLFQEALQHLEAARALRPASPGVWAAMGDVLEELGRYEEAVPVCRTAIDRGADWTWVHVNLGRSLREGQGLQEQALECFRRAIQISPRYAKGHSDIGVSLAALGRHAEAVESYRRAIRTSPENAWVHGNLGVSLGKLGREEEALDSMRRALDINPDNAVVPTSLAWLLVTAQTVELRNPAEAVRLARRATARTPRGSDHWGALGAAQYRAGEVAGAVSALQKAGRLAKRQGRDGSPLQALFLAMALHLDGDPEQARAWYDRACQWMEAETPRDPDHARFRAEAAEVLGIEESDDE
ncbi:MAG: tetratricopeptide repeat protein, partial [Planctomycetota bacterium]